MFLFEVKLKIYNRSRESGFTTARFWMICTVDIRWELENDQTGKKIVCVCGAGGH